MIGRLNKILTCPSFSRHITYYAPGDGWKLSAMESMKIGKRTLVLSESDLISKDNANRMGFELQTKGIQPVFCTMSTHYPVNKNIDEIVDMFRRTGSKSIIAIGSGALQDTAKAIRLMVETNTGRFSDINKPLAWRDHVPLLSVATTVSSVHSLTSFGVLHFEDDVLVKTQSYLPEVLVFDTELIEKNATYIPEVYMVYLLSQLFDNLFAIALYASDCTSTDERNNVLTIDMLTRMVNTLVQSPSDRKTLANNDNNQAVNSKTEYFQQFDALYSVDLLKLCHTATTQDVQDLNLQLFDLSSVVKISTGSNTDIKQETTSILLKIAERVGIMRSRVQNSSNHALHCSMWPGIIETNALLVALNVENELSLPFGWTSAAVFRDVVYVLATDKLDSNGGTGSVYTRPSDANIMTAMHLAYDALLKITNLTHEQVNVLSENSTLQVAQRIKKTPKKFHRVQLAGKKASASNDYQLVSPAGHLEKLITIEEMNQDKENIQRHVAAGGNERNVNEVIKKADMSLRMKMLNSNVMSDLVEKIMSH